MVSERYLFLTQRISIKDTREIINAIHDGSLEKAQYETLPIFNLRYPTTIRGVDPNILNPRQSWSNKGEYDESLKKVAGMFQKNFKKFENDASEQVKKGGPH
jgi:phosphoenolpyruvate carboxykinase (ATP)